ncbi:FadR/GntR family transcriptional regulator [Capnocytophaga canimorsus]|uniref:FadR/GntR family transcriptional regulator n=1 Tax=Capnocytophaga canimorsus TaxID=28188 RepID=UPI0037D41EBB
MPMDSIKPIENVSLVDRVEQRIMEYIKENNLKPGDSLPKEIQFSEWLGVSRTAIREAMSRLRTLGLVESKKHRGMILKEPDLVENFEKMLNPQILDEATLQDLFEFRLMFEIGMVDFVFARKTHEQIRELEQLVSESENVQCNDKHFSLETEVKFHKALYKMANNNMLFKFQRILLPVFQYVHELQKNELNYHSWGGGFTDAPQKVVTHKDLVRELKEGTPQSFREAMRMHLEPHFKRNLKKRGELL